MAGAGRTRCGSGDLTGRHKSQPSSVRLAVPCFQAFGLHRWVTMKHDRGLNDDGLAARALSARSADR